MTTLLTGPRWPLDGYPDPIPFDRHHLVPARGQGAKVDRLAPARARGAAAARFWNSCWDGIEVAQDAAGHIYFLNRETGNLIRHPIGLKPELLWLAKEAEGHADHDLHWAGAPPVRTFGGCA